MSNSQESRMLNMLRRAGGRGIKNYEFQRSGILCYTKIISNLREDKWDIITERLYLENGRATGIFYYVLLEDKPAKKPWWKR